MLTFSSFFFFFLKNNFGILFAGLFDIQSQAIFMHGEPGAIVYKVFGKLLLSNSLPQPHLRPQDIRYKCANRLRGGDGNSACFAG